MFSLLLLHAAARAAAPDDITTGQRVWFDGLDTSAMGYTSTTSLPSNPASGSALSSWRSKINGSIASVSIPGKTAPTYLTSTNGIGANYSINGQALSVAGDIWGGTGTTVPAMEHLIVATSSNSANTGFLFSSELGSGNNTNRISSHFAWAGTIYFDPVCCLANRSVSWTLSTNRLYITDWFFSTASNTKSLIVNATNTLMNALTSVGTYTVPAGAYFSLGYGETTHAGLISESIVYNRLLLAAEKRILNNYISAKWGIAIGAESRYAGNTAGNGLYRYHVGGIGQESTGSVTSGTSEGLTISNGSFLAAGRYVLAGLPGLSAAGTMNAYDQASSTILTAPKQLSGTAATFLPAGFTWRGNRVWYLSKTDATSGAGTINLSFDVAGKMGISGVTNGDTLKLLYRANATSNFQVVATSTYSGSSVSFAVAGTSVANGYYTIGKGGTPLPVVAKTVVTESDPVNGTTTPKSMPGAWVLYTVTLTNQGDGSLDANSVSITDTVPTNADLFVNALAPSATPFIFTNPTVGAPTSVVSCGLGLAAANITWYDSLGAVIATPTPDGQGFASAVRSFKLAPTGTLAAATVANTPPYPSCSFTFRVRVK